MRSSLFDSMLRPSLTMMLLLSCIAITKAAETRVPKDNTPPPVHIVRNVCAFECCEFGEWTAKEAIPLYSAPDENAIVRNLAVGEKVEAITGELHTLPIRARVKGLYRDDENSGLQVGEEVYLLGYGYDYPHVWAKGKIIKVSFATKFELLEEKGIPTWWVQVRAKDAREGWVKDPYQNGRGLPPKSLQFEGMESDDCGGQSAPLGDTKTIATDEK